MDSAYAPVSVIAQVSDADKWPNGWCTFSQFSSESLGVMITSGSMDRAHALSYAMVVTK